MSLSFLLALNVRRHERMRMRSRRRHHRKIPLGVENSKAWVASSMEEEEQEEVEKKRSTSMQDWVLPEIPVDVLIEIMTRLPGKSVLKFKCLSKFWSSLLSSRDFCNRFLMVPSQPRLYMSLLDLDDYSKSLLLSSAPSTCCPSSSSSLVFDQDLTICKMGGYFLRVLRGFICFTFESKPRIYNPTTRQLVILPAIQGSNILAEEDHYDIFYFMGHDPVNDQLKLLCTISNMSNHMQKIKSERWVFVLEAGGSWRRVANEFPPHIPNPYELNMNGFLYLLAWTDMYTCVLVSFDVRLEEISMMIQVPRKAGDEMIPRVTKMATLIDYGGKVAVFDYTHIRRSSGTVDLWVLEDGRKKEWSRKTMFVQPSQRHLLIGTDNLFPKGTSLKDKVILVPRTLACPFYFLCYDLQINDLKKVVVKGIPDRWFSKDDTDIDCDIEFMNPSESIHYLEA